MPLSPLRDVRANGLVTLIKENRTTPAVTILVAVRAGAFYDTPEGEGTAALLARVLDRGTTRQSAAEIADVLDSRGASLSVVAGRHQLIASATCLAEDFDTTFGLLSEIIRTPRLAASEVDIRRAELQTAILQDEDDPGAVAVDRVMAQLYPRHPYGQRPRGTVASVGRITAERLAAFHGRLVTPLGTTVVIVGDVSAHHVLQRTAELFDSWHVPRAPEPRLSPIEPATARELLTVPMMSKAQADIAYGFVGLRRSDPDYYPAWVMNNAFGQYALGGRLGDRIREREGLAYYVYSSLDATLAEGPVLVRAGVAGTDVDRAIASIDEEIAAVRRDGFSAHEVAESQSYLVGSIPRQLETNAGIAGFLLSAEFHGLGVDHDRELPDLVHAVTLDQVNRVASRLLDPACAAIVVAGPYERSSAAVA